MNILGPDALVFGVVDLAACRQYLLDYGLTEAADGCFEAVDGTAIIVRSKDDPSLPPALGTASMLRETIYGVADEATLDKIERELRRDREVSAVRALSGRMTTWALRWHSALPGVARFHRRRRSSIRPALRPSDRSISWPSMNTRAANR